MVTVYLFKNLRNGHAEVCLADRSHSMLLDFCQNYKYGRSRRYVVSAPACRWVS
jgi:hypothetical protein